MEPIHPINDIDIDSTWINVLDGTFGVSVVDRDEEDVIVLPFEVSNGERIFSPETKKLNWFKLLNRYIRIR